MWRKTKKTEDRKNQKLGDIGVEQLLAPRFSLLFWRNDRKVWFQSVICAIWGATCMVACTSYILSNSITTVPLYINCFWIILFCLYEVWCYKNFSLKIKILSTNVHTVGSIYKFFASVSNLANVLQLFELIANFYLVPTSICETAGASFERNLLILYLMWTYLYKKR